MNHDPRRLIARLAVAVMAADGKIAAAEQTALAHMDELGLGVLSPFARDEIARAVDGPLDIAGAATALAELGPEAGAVIVTALAELAVSDGELAPKELETLRSIGVRLGLGAAAVDEILAAAVGGTTAPSTAGHRPDASTTARADKGPLPCDGRSNGPPALDARLGRAYWVLGVTPSDDVVTVDAAYLKLIARYNPDKLTDLGADFAVLAVQRLAEATAAYQLVCAARKDRPTAREAAPVGTFLLH